MPLFYGKVNVFLCNTIIVPSINEKTNERMYIRNLCKIYFYQALFFCQKYFANTDRNIKLIKTNKHEIILLQYNWRRKICIIAEKFKGFTQLFPLQKKTIYKKYFHGQNMKKKYAIVLFKSVCSIIPYLIAFLTSYA